MDKFASDILNAPASPVQVLLLSDANPLFGTPSVWRVKEALLKVPYIASFGSFLDETSILSDLILPDHSFLESWVQTMYPKAARRKAEWWPAVAAPSHETDS